MVELDESVSAVRISVAKPAETSIVSSRSLRRNVMVDVTVAARGHRRYAARLRLSASLSVFLSVPMSAAMQTAL